MAGWVIVVDDDEQNLKIAGRILSRAHMRVTAMKSGEALIDYIREKEVPDLILLDVKMPGMDGFETLTELRKMDKGKMVPVIFLTGVNDREHIEGVLALRPQGYLLKPPVQEKLLETIRKAIR